MKKNENLYIPIQKKESFVQEKKKLLGIIFSRACCCLGIVIFHYFSHSEGNFKIFYTTANSSFGFMFVTSYFCISGAVLFYNYSKIKSIKIFYFKRWKSIFPQFYLFYIYFFISETLRKHELVYKRKFYKIFFTLTGLDGYLLYKFNTFYLIGEWFLGPLIILYLLYPFLCNLIAKNYIFSTSLLLSMNIFLYTTNFFTIDPHRNIISCLNSFYFGITTIKFKKIFFDNNISFIISFILLLFTSIIKIHPFVLLFQIQGFLLFITLTKIGQYLMLKKVYFVFYNISILSYSIYLCHHRIIYDILSINNPNKWYSHLLLLSIAFLLIIILSKIHLIIVNHIFGSELFKKFESLFY